MDAFPGENFKGEVKKIRLNAAMNQNVVTYTVEIATNNADGRLLPYLTANVIFELQQLDKVLQAPNAALRRPNCRQSLKTACPATLTTFGTACSHRPIRPETR